MTISSLGVGSNLDLNSILTQLMQIEQQPLVALQQKEASYQARISALGTLKSALSSVQTAAQGFIPSTTQTATEKFASFKALVADSTVASASTTTGAVAGSYSLEVTALAQSQRLTSSAGLTSITTGGTLKIELGTLSGSSPTATFTGDGARTLEISVADGATIESIRDAINTAAADGRVSATIVNGTSGKQLILSSGNSGLSNVMKLSGISGLDFDPAGAGSGTLSQATANGGQAASDAAFKLNGIAATSSTNSVSNVLDGVTLTLTKTNAGTPTTITVTRDATSTLTTALNTFIKAYNEAAKSMKDLGYYDATAKKAGALQGDAALRGAQSQIRNLLQTKAGGSSNYQMLTDIGIKLQSDGTLKLDSAKLSDAISADYAGVSQLVSKIGSSFKDGIDGLVGSAGTVSAATDSTNKIIASLTKRQTELSDRLTQTEARYRKQFSALDSLVASMNKTSTYLTQQLANLPKISSSSN